MSFANLFDPLIPHIEKSKDLAAGYLDVLCDHLIAIQKSIENADDYPVEADRMYFHRQITTDAIDGTDVSIVQIPANEIWEIEVVTFCLGESGSSLIVHKDPNFGRPIYAHETGSSVQQGLTENPHVLVPGGEEIFFSTLGVTTQPASVYLQLRRYRPSEHQAKYRFKLGRSRERYTNTGTHDMRDSLVRGVPQASPNGD